MNILPVYLNTINRKALKCKDGIYRIDKISYYVKSNKVNYLATTEGLYDIEGNLLLEYKLTGFSSHRETKQILKDFLSNKWYDQPHILKDVGLFCI